MPITTSAQFQITKRDLIRGFLIAIISPVFVILIASLSAGTFVFDLQQIGATATAAALSYILKNFLTPARVFITDPNVVKAVKEGSAVEVEVISKSNPQIRTNKTIN